MNFQLIYIPWAIGILIATYFLFRAVKRIIKGIINYRKLGREEFMKRLSQGFDNISPTQKAKAEIRGIIISLVGLVAGIITFSIVRVENIWWWAILIMLGGLVITGIQLVGKIQQYRAFKKQDEIFKQVMAKEEENVIQ